jgi:hypothetical protein
MATRLSAADGLCRARIFAGNAQSDLAKKCSKRQFFGQKQGKICHFYDDLLEALNLLNN